MVMCSPSGWLQIEGAAPAQGFQLAVPLHIARPLPSRLPHCPCSRCNTLSRRGIYAICPVCFRE